MSTTRQGLMAGQGPSGRRRLGMAGESTWTVGLFGVIFWVVVEYMRFQDKYAILAGIPFGDISLGLLFLGLLTNKGGMRSGGSIGAWTIVLIGWGFLCSVMAEASIFRDHRFYDTLKTLMVFFVLVSVLNTPKRLLYFVYALMVVYFAHTNFSIREWALSGFHGLPKGQYVGAGFLRNPNDFGAALSAAWGMSLFLARYDTGLVFNRWPVRWLHIVNTACFLIGVVTCSSRGTALGMAAGGIYLWLVFVKGMKAKMAWLVPLALIVVVIIAAMSDDQLARFDTMGEDASSQDRLRTWSVAWRAFTENPVFGLGFGNFGAYTLPFWGDGMIYVQHNILLQAMTDMGFLGLVIVLGLFISSGVAIHGALAHRRKNPGKTSTTEAILLGCGVCLVSLFFNGQTITVLYYPFTWVLFAVTAAAVYLAHEEHADPKRRGSRRLREAPEASDEAAEVPGVVEQVPRTGMRRSYLRSRGT